MRRNHLAISSASAKTTDFEKRSVDAAFALPQPTDGLIKPGGDLLFLVRLGDSSDNIYKIPEDHGGYVGGGSWSLKIVNVQPTCTWASATKAIFTPLGAAIPKRHLHLARSAIFKASQETMGNSDDEEESARVSMEEFKSGLRLLPPPHQMWSGPTSCALRRDAQRTPYRSASLPNEQHRALKPSGYI